MKALPLLLALSALPACGGGSDPVVDKDEAASAPAIDASVKAAANTAIEAELKGTGRQNDPEARNEVALNVIGEEVGTNRQ